MNKDFEENIKNIAYNCKTLEDAQDFLYQCIERDIGVWRCACWDVYKENTCFSIKDNRVGYAQINFYKMNNYKIVEYRKGDNMYQGRFEPLHGNGQCSCVKCGGVSWTDFCYRVNDKNNEYNNKIICSTCKKDLE